MHNFIVREAIIPGPEFQAASREDAVRDLVASLQRSGVIAAIDESDIVQAILRRERLGTTGIGHTIAIPHTRHQAVVQLSGTLAVSPRGINWDSVDGEPVHVIVLLVSPPDRPGEHLRALENVVTRFKDETFAQSLRAATSVDEIWALISRSQSGGST